MIYTIKVNNKTYKADGTVNAMSLYVKETLKICNTVEEVEKAKDELIANCESILIDIGIGKSNKSYFKRMVNRKARNKITMLNIKQELDGGFNMGKYFKETDRRCPRVTTNLVYLFKVKYENYYGKKCNIKEDKLHYEIERSFELFELDIYDPGDREWYEKNVLQDLFKKYDDLGYSEGSKFCAGHLHVDWLMYKLVNNIPK